MAPTSNNGSEWHIWDLHFHSPSSYDYGDKSVTNERIIDVLKKSNTSVVAITDHHVMDVSRIKELQHLGKAAGVTVLPGIEFLSDARGKEPVHFIAIFSENANLDYIWPQIENRTAISKVRGEQKALNEVYCDLPETISLIKELGGIVSIHAGEKSGSVENITHSLPHTAAQKRDVADAVDIYELGKLSDQEGYRKHVFPTIGKVLPMIICSDNHNINKYFLKAKLWIKGSPNFSGLAYALKEPDERFFLGEEPESIVRARQNPTKYIKSLKVKNIENQDVSNIWFEDISIPFSSELTTIIGNKGNGKSAISDILALCLDSEHSEDYLFLQKNKFKKKGLAERFAAEAELATGSWTPSKTLDYVTPAGEQPKVRYLPQSYFEKICNEIGKTEAFRREIESVVFQYVPMEIRLGKTNFRDLATHKQSLISEKISELKNKLSEINKKIADLEDKSHPDHIKNIESRIKLKNAELTAHLSARPPVRTDPSLNVSDPNVIARSADLQEWTKLRDTISLELAEIDQQIVKKSIKLDTAKRFRQEILEIETKVVNFVKEKTSVATELNLAINEIVKITVDLSQLNSQIENLQTEKDQLIIQASVDSYSEDIEFEKLATLALKKSRCDREIKKLQAQFSGEQKDYQDYLESLRIWEAKKTELEGNELNAGSLLQLQAELKYIETELPIELTNTKTERLKISEEIFSKKTEIRSFYDEIKTEIDKCFLEVEIPGLAIVSKLAKDKDLEEKILSFIHQNKSGSFYGPEGKAVLFNEITGNVDWNNSGSITTMLTQLVDYLENDRRAAAKPDTKTQISNLVKNRQGFYDFLFALDYVEPHYDLQQNEKSLDQLSPGEKGALLLVFYLLIDKEDIPLVIDQPEDNLDNYSVAKILVPFIRKAKKKRQIIIVTHNPNLAVVADSEQVIRVNIDKAEGNRFSFISGGIEEGHINKAIVEVLEGTLPAFSARKEKYQTLN